MHTHTFGRQLKITFLDVSDYFEYSDSNISNLFFEEAKNHVLQLWQKSNNHLFIIFTDSLYKTKIIFKNFQFMFIWVISSIIDKRLYLTLFDFTRTLREFVQILLRLP